MARSPKGKGIKRLNRDEVDLLMETIRKYRVLSGQLSNTSFNLAQKLRTPKDGYESTLGLVRDWDSAERDLCQILNDTRLYKRLDDVMETSNGN